MCPRCILVLRRWSNKCRCYFFRDSSVTLSPTQFLNHFRYLAFLGDLNNFSGDRLTKSRKNKTMRSRRPYKSILRTEMLHWQRSIKQPGRHNYCKENAFTLDLSMLIDADLSETVIVFVAIWVLSADIRACIRTVFRHL